jgi:hypothetical protein
MQNELVFVYPRLDCHEQLCGEIGEAIAPKVKV